MTTARVRYRNHVSYGCIAITFCDIKFYGDDAERFNKEWIDIKYEKYNKYRSELDICRQEYKNLLKEEKALVDKIDKNKHLVCLKRLKNLNVSNENEITKNMRYSCQELVDKAEKYLASKGFVLKNCSCSDSIHYDIWELDRI